MSGQFHTYLAMLMTMRVISPRRLDLALSQGIAEEVEGVHGSSKRTLSETQMFAVATLRAAPVV